MAEPMITMLAGGKVSVNGRIFDDVQTALETLARENKPQRVSAKVAPKGGLSVYGLQRRPVTLYKSQWIRLMQAWDPVWLTLPGLVEKGDAPANEGATANVPAATPEPEPEPEPTKEELAEFLRARREGN